MINKRILMTVLFSMTVLGVSATDIYIPSLPQMVKEFHVSPTLINSTILLFNLGMALAVLYSGILSNRFGRKKILVSAIWLFSLASLLIVITPNIWLILILRAMQGLACGGWMVVQRLILRDTMNQSDQVHAGGILVLGSIVSPAVAPVLGAFLAHLWNWRLCFLFSAMLGICISLISAMVIPETNTTPIKHLPKLGAYLRDYVALLADPVCFNLVMVIGLTFATYFAFIGVSSYLYITQLGLSPLNYSYIFLLLASGYFIGNSYMMYLNKRGVGPMQIIKIGVIGGVGGGILLFFALMGHNHWLILISVTAGVMITRIAAALVINPIHIKVVNHFKERGALALGIAVCFQYGAAGVAAAVVGLFTEPKLLYGFICLSNGLLIIAAVSFFIVANSESPQII